MESNIYSGRNPLRVCGEPVRGDLGDLVGEPFYRIANYDRMRPFFMTIVSDADHWLFISSNGGLTAGRRDANLALFPYYTDDKLRDMAQVTGSKTLLQVRHRNRIHLWEPFSACGNGAYRVRRNLYKSLWGNQLVFEEINADLGLTFRYGWFNSRQFGFVRRAWLTNWSRASTRIRLLDGLQNLMPCGADSQFNLEYSTLLDAYKKNELLPETGLGLYRLSAIPVDRPEPAEALRTTVAWSIGLKRRLTLLSPRQLDRFRAGERLQPESDMRAERGAYLVEADLQTGRGQSVDWLFCADVNQGPSDVAQLNQWLHKPSRLRRQILADVRRGTEALRRIVAQADGMQQTDRPLSCARHYNNTLFNIMRGGVFNAGYTLDSRDLLAFVRNADRHLAARHAPFFRRLPKSVTLGDMVKRVARLRDPQLERLCREYLPLTFSRRHGDPSRPWNRFSIATTHADGTPNLNYEGNWRDIFQNWEALALSFPAYAPGMICRFLNASTADGYNPYRITRDGIDWEVQDPQDPWSYIGYWGDHQIIYLLKLLEQLDQHDPAALRGFLSIDLFAYANVPYRLKPYERLLEDPKNTVVFDDRLENLIHKRVQARGADGKLVWDRHEQVRLVSLAEKLLVPLLAKLSNFVPGAGIWLNTQRPEWNDANNALVGNGASMVTLYYMRRYLEFCQRLFSQCSAQDFHLSAEIAGLLKRTHQTLKRHRRLLAGKITEAPRKAILDGLGRAGSDFRQRLYNTGLSDRKSRISGRRVLDFLSLVLDWTDHSIRSNRRPDGLYHAYNLLQLENRKALSIRRLYEMLEGQVAVLSSGYLTAQASLKLLTALKGSALYRPDQHSYLLYPDRELPRFVDKNNIPPRALRRSSLLKALLAQGNTQLVERDVAGRVHFNSTVKNARDLDRLLDQFEHTRHARNAKRERGLILEIFEQLFDHASFTGRSGTFFGYEGLGCIYWHMVSKLLLAAQEAYWRAADSHAPRSVLRGLANAYYDIRAGIGDHKTPHDYGAFPMDPYSHTPGHGGARQPGLTGQVKEDFLCRFGELGVRVKGGQVHFCPGLLRRQEFVTQRTEFAYHDVSGAPHHLFLKPGELAYTYCQVPIIYRLARRNSIAVVRSDGTRQTNPLQQLDSDVSHELFDRTGRIRRLEVGWGPDSIMSLH